MIGSLDCHHPFYMEQTGLPDGIYVTVFAVTVNVYEEDEEGYFGQEDVWYSGDGRLSREKAEKEAENDPWWRQACDQNLQSEFAGVESVGYYVTRHGWWVFEEEAI